MPSPWNRHTSEFLLSLFPFPSLHLGPSRRSSQRSAPSAQRLLLVPSSLGSSCSPPVCWKPRRCLQKSILARLVPYQEVDSYAEQKDGFRWKSDLCPVTTVPNRPDTQDVKISLCRHHHLFQYRKPMTGRTSRGIRSNSHLPSQPGLKGPLIMER